MTPRRLIYRATIIFIFCSFAGPARAQSGVTADAATLAFGGVGVNTYSDPQTLILKNTGAGDGAIGTVNLMGEDPRQFLISRDFCSSAVLANGESCEVDVIYAPFFDLPGGVGPSAAILQVPFETSPALMISLSGTGLLPQIESDVAGLGFPEKTTGQSSDTSNLTISNAGQTDLDILLVTISGPDALSFNVEGDNCSFQTLAPGATCLLEVFFRPLVIGDLVATLLVQSEDPVNPVLSVGLTGKGKGSGGCSLLESASGGATFPILPWVLFLLPALRAAYSGRGQPIHPNCCRNRRSGCRAYSPLY